MQKIEVWVSGFATDSGLVPPRRIGAIEAKSFKKAAELLLGKSRYFNKRKCTYFGSKLYDSEQSANTAEVGYKLAMEHFRIRRAGDS